MPFGDLPVEIVQRIASSADTYRDQSALAMSCKATYDIIEPLLWQEGICYTRECVNHLYRAFQSRPGIARHLRRLDFRERWMLFNEQWECAPPSSETTEAIDSACRRAVRILTAAGPGLRSFKLASADELPDTHSSFSLALPRLSGLTVLHLSGLGYSTCPVLSGLQDLHAPINEIALDGFHGTGDHIFNLINNFRDTLKSLRLHNGKVPPLPGNTGCWPNVHNLRIWRIDLDLPTIEAAFPNVVALAYMGCRPINSSGSAVTYTMKGWTKLRFVNSFAFPADELWFAQPVESLNLRAQVMEKTNFVNVFLRVLSDLHPTTLKTPVHLNFDFESFALSKGASSIKTLCADLEIEFAAEAAKTSGIWDTFSQALSTLPSLRTLRFNLHYDRDHILAKKFGFHQEQVDKLALLVMTTAEHLEVLYTTLSEYECAENPRSTYKVYRKDAGTAPIVQEVTMDTIRHVFKHSWCSMNAIVSDDED